MEKCSQQGFTLTGLPLGKKTSNALGQSALDCAALWQRFNQEGCFEKIEGKLDKAVYAVYYEYEGDHLCPFSYFIGCRVDPSTDIPQGMEVLHIPKGNYAVVTAKGKMPGCITMAWQQIWQSPIDRAYMADYEVYDENSMDWENARVDIFLSVH